MTNHGERTATERPYLSIGEVLGLLLDEFPDVTISKIRFLESQGLIEPERTPSGYRKFYDADVERLRFILREQRENYLPLKVIRDRLEGETPSGGVQRPDAAARSAADDGAGAAHAEQPSPSTVRSHPSGSAALPGSDPRSQVDPEPLVDGERAAPTVATWVDGTMPAAPGRLVAEPSAPDPPSAAAGDAATVVTTPPGAPPSSAAEEPPAAVPEAPATRAASDVTVTAPVPVTPPAPPATSAPPAALAGAAPAAGRDLDGQFSRGELLGASGIDGALLDQLESYGLVSGRPLGQQVVYDDTARRICELAARFHALGIEARHLRAWKTSAEREASLFEQRILPLLRQRNPHAREQSATILSQLTDLGANLREALVAQALQPYQG